MAVNSGTHLFDHAIPPTALPAHVFGQEWRNPLQSVGQDQLTLTPTDLDAKPYMGPDDTQLTQVSCIPGPVDNSLARPIDLSLHLDYSIDFVSLLLDIMSVYTSLDVHVLSLEFPPLINGLTDKS